MEIQQFYTSIGVDCSDLLNRLGSESFVRKYLLRFPSDPTFASLTKAMQQKDGEGAFRAVHSLKGIAANLELTPLLDACSDLTEELRDGHPDPSRAEALYGRIASCYRNIIEIIRLLDV